MRRGGRRVKEEVRAAEVMGVVAMKVAEIRSTEKAGAVRGAEASVAEERARERVVGGKLCVMDCGWLVRGSSESERPGRIGARSRRTGSGPACSARRRCRYGRSRTCRLSAQLHALACHAVGGRTASVAGWLMDRPSTHLALKSLAPAVAFPSSGLVEGIPEVLATSTTIKTPGRALNSHTGSAGGKL